MYEAVHPLEIMALLADGRKVLGIVPAGHGAIVTFSDEDGKAREIAEHARKEPGADVIQRLADKLAA
jgi:hypothetical protein